MTNAPKTPTQSHERKDCSTLEMVWFAMTTTGYCPSWIDHRVSRSTLADRIRDAIFRMSSTREDKLRIASVVTNCVLGGVLLWATWSTKTLTNHETRLTTHESWRAEKSPILDGIVREQGELKTRLAIMQDQFVRTDSIIREVSAKLSVMSDAMIRMQEAQSGIKEKLIYLQNSSDELSKGATK